MLASLMEGAFESQFRFLTLFFLSQSDAKNALLKIIAKTKKKIVTQQKYKKNIKKIIKVRDFEKFYEKIER